MSGLDASIDVFFSTVRTPGWNAFFEILTHIGDTLSITIVSLSVAIVLARRRQYPYIGGLAAALFGSLIVSYLIKIIVHRARPALMYALLEVPGYSFPSMHAATSLATYGFLAYSIWKLVQPPHHRMPAVIALSTLAVLVGFSRVYLGVHYASDVLAGWCIGALFLWLGTSATKHLARR